MKKNIFLLVVLAIVIASCGDSGKVKTTAKEFIEAVKNNDNATYCELYPLLRNLKDVQITSELDDDISVDGLDGNDSLYEANVGDKVQLVCKVTKNGCEIVDSHGLLIFPSSYSDLAAKTGVPLRTLSDKKIMKLLGDEGQFVQYLYNQDYSLTNMHITITNQRYEWRMNYGSASAKCTNNLTNDGKTKIDASDYEIEITLRQNSTGKELRKIKSYSQDIEPGSTVLTEDDISSFYNICRNRDLNWTITIKPKKPKATILAKYGDFKGDEYAHFSGKTTEKAEEEE